MYGVRLWQNMGEKDTLFGLLGPKKPNDHQRTCIAQSTTKAHTLPGTPPHRRCIAFLAGYALLLYPLLCKDLLRLKQPVEVPLRYIGHPVGQVERGRLFGIRPVRFRRGEENHRPPGIQRRELRLIGGG